LLWVGLCGPAAAQASASYSMERVALSAAGSSSSSASYATTSAVQWDSLSGATSFCNAGYVTSLGFVTARGPLAVPTRLHMSKTYSTPSAVRLTWSGTASFFRIYRAKSAQQLVDASNLAGFSLDCNGADSEEPGDLLFYKVVPGGGS
jgi:hypothetical protein